jgi:anhydro-N-acetylmuramic acid kinase
MATPSYRAIGVMSGSSLDGIDLALCALHFTDGRWNFHIQRTRTIPYDAPFRERLRQVMVGSALDLARLHVELGRMIGHACREFMGTDAVDVIGSHGHTLFHLPGEGITTQIGSGAEIAALTGVTTVCDFRTSDVALGGQGAPLVPLGEQLLFPDVPCFLNLGGIANISVHAGEKVTGYDIGPCNMAFNLLAEEAGMSYDEGGGMAASGVLDSELLEQLNALPFYQQPPPRSLGREWFEDQVRPLIKDQRLLLNDRLRTVVEHVAVQLARELDRHGVQRVVVTGGGAFNNFLIERLRSLTSTSIELPGKELIEQKEALIFALLGVLRLRGEVNALASVTGAKRDSIGGSVYLGDPPR